MNENERHLYALNEQQSKDINEIKVNQKEDMTEIKVKLAEIQKDLSCVNDLKKKCAEIESRIDKLERKPIKFLEHGITVVITLGLSALFNWIINK